MDGYEYDFEFETEDKCYDYDVTPDWLLCQQQRIADAAYAAHEAWLAAQDPNEPPF